jgi:prevent-host-death family protein
MARTIRKSGVKEAPLSEVKDDLSRYLREAETQEIVITRHGKPAGVLIGFESEEDGSSIALKTIRAFCAELNRRAKACVRVAVSGWKTSNGNNNAPQACGCHQANDRHFTPPALATGPMYFSKRWRSATSRFSLVTNLR